MTTEREAFEAWWLSHEGFPDPLLWDAWQACAALKDKRIAELTVKRDALRETAIRNKMMAEVMEADSARYRWLRNSQNAHRVAVNWNIGHDWIGVHFEQLDAAIDEAMKNT